MAPLQLNALQREAALADIHRPLLIIAAAGTGKTSTLCGRVAHLVAQDVPPKAILLLAFSRQAVDDLRRRLGSVVAGGAQALGQYCIQTFHGWSFHLLNKFWRQAGFSRPPVVVGEDDAQLKEVLGLCLRWAKLEPCRAHMCQWLGLPSNTTWPALIESAAAAEPELFSRCLSAHVGSTHVGSNTLTGTSDDAAASSSGTKAADNCTHTAAARVDAYAALSTRSKVAFVVDLFLELCKLHDRAAYTFQYLSDPTATSAAELQMCWQWVQDQAAQGRCLAQSSQAAAAAAAQGSTVGWEQEQHAQQGVFEAAGRLFAVELAAMNTVRLAELPLLARLLLRGHPAVLERVRRRWEYLLVDELQDLCAVQAELVELLQGGRGQVTAVGDDDQRIMSFLHAVPNLFSQFDAAFQPHRVCLKANYRCTPAICAVGTAALMQGSRLSGKEPLEAARQGSGSPVLVQQYGSIEEEASALAAAIKSLVDSGRPPQELAVLFRCMSLAGRPVYQPLADALTRVGVPFVLAQRTRVLELPVVQEVLAYLQLLVNPDDDIALLKLLSSKRSSLGHELLSSLMDAYHAAKLSGSSSRRPSLFSCAQAMCTASSSSSGRVQGGGEGVEFQRGLAHLRELLQLVGRMRAGGVLCSSLYELTVPEVLQHVLLEAGVGQQPGFDTECQEQVEDKAGLQALTQLPQQAQKFSDQWQPPVAEEAEHGVPSLQRLALEALPESVSLAEALCQLGPEGAGACSAVAEAIAARNRAGPAVLRDFLAHLHTEMRQEPQEQGVVFSTIHAAKGLEWPVVYMPTVCDGYLPARCLQSADGDCEGTLEAHLQEEARLFHVAATRARDLLSISYVQGPAAVCPSTDCPLACSLLLCRVVRRLRSQPWALDFRGQLPDDEGEGGGCWAGAAAASQGGQGTGDRGSSSGGQQGGGELSKAEQVRQVLAQRRQQQVQSASQAPAGGQQLQGGQGAASRKRPWRGRGAFNQPRART